MKKYKTENSAVLKAWKQNEDPLCEIVVNCFKTDLSSIKAALIYLNQLFKSKGITNNASKLILKGLEDFNSWFHYYDILRVEIVRLREANKVYKIEVQRLREELILLKQDSELNNYNN